MKFKGLTLDQFQIDAIKAIEDNHSVMVSAPTGSGKTLIADYIINRDLKEGKRVVYTAPIKALSNQKYQDFVSDYGSANVGLLTGDIVINPTAPILIMTAEVYRNMVVVQDSCVDAVSYVIFDEIHYISDRDRGHIWEESIIFSPQHVRFICLSATVPNAGEFAGWISHVKKHKVVCVLHEKRPVPLQRSFYDAELGIASLEDIQEVQKLDKYPKYRGSYKKAQKQKPKQVSHIDVVRDIKDSEGLPALYFVFSRVDAQRKAKDLGKKHSFLNKEEREESIRHIRSHFKDVDERLQSLDSARLLRQLLPKGIGFHHAGLLPVLKHLVEGLFAKKLIHVLFTTETFAVGINMPARTVVFNSLRKFDGIEFRYLNSKEYFQLAGRAGRRGIDDFGRAIAVINRRFDDVKKIRRFTGKDTLPIKSQFKLSYNTVLNLIACHPPEKVRVVLESNFYTYQRRNTAGIHQRYDKMSATLEKMGYLSKGNLTEKGHFIRNIFVDELVTGEIFGTEFFHGLSKYQILLITAALVYEPRATVKIAPPIGSKEVKELVRKIGNNSYLRRIKKLKNIITLTALVKPINQEEDFISLLDHINFLEGDLMRFLRQMIDRLQQIRKATTDEVLTDVINQCTESIDTCLEGIEVI
jgi:superfamily II RNA helicase